MSVSTRLVHMWVLEVAAFTVSFANFATRISMSSTTQAIPNSSFSVRWLQPRFLQSMWMMRTRKQRFTCSLRKLVWLSAVAVWTSNWLLCYRIYHRCIQWGRREWGRWGYLLGWVLTVRLLMGYRCYQGISLDTAKHSSMHLTTTD